MKNKLIAISLILFLLIGCSKGKDPIEPADDPDVKFTYQIKEGLEFREGEAVDFSDAIVGNFDSYELGTIKKEVGDHILSVTLIKNGQKKVIGVPYTIRDNVPSDNNYLKSLQIGEYQLSPQFKKELDSYSVEVPSHLDSYQVTAIPEDSMAKVIEGDGLVDNLGYDFNHQVVVEAEDGSHFYYYIYFILKDSETTSPTTGSEIEVWNGYEINYPNSTLATIRNDYLTLVNKSYRIDKYYVPSDLVVLDSQYQTIGGTMLVRDAYNAFIRMTQAASEEGLSINVGTCYRDYEYQKGLYTYYLGFDSQAVVDTSSARPGHSEHHLGLACDFVAGHLALYDFTGTSEDLWLREHADEYGFILRYPSDKAHITGYEYESWHYRYVGVDQAKKIKESGLTLEEYLNR